MTSVRLYWQDFIRSFLRKKTALQTEQLKVEFQKGININDSFDGDRVGLRIQGIPPMTERGVPEERHMRNTPELCEERRQVRLLDHNDSCT